MKNLFTILVLLLAYANLDAQCSGQIFLSSQADVDNFVNDYGCTTIDGDLIVGSVSGVPTNINDLSGLSGLTGVTGTLWVIHTIVPNLNGLENVNSVGGNFIICDNPAVTDITAVENMDSIGGDLMVNYNAILQTCCTVPVLLEATGGSLILFSNGSGCNDLGTIGIACCNFGCTDPLANNYDSNATCDNESCQYLGCTDMCDTNYDSTANTNAPNACSGISNCGCTNPNACNYDASITQDDGSCIYPLTDCTCEDTVGCTDELANNYDSNATCDDGSCNYAPTCGDLFTEENILNGASSFDGGFVSTVICPDNPENFVSVSFTNYYIEYAAEGGCWDGLEIWEDTNEDQVFSPNYGSSDGDSLIAPHDPIYAVCGTSVEELPNGGNFLASTPGTCLIINFVWGIWIQTPFSAPSGWTAEVNCLPPTLGCTDFCDTNYDSSATIYDATTCSGISICGCMDPNACNYDASVTIEDNSCEYPLTGCTCEDTLGCTDAQASNYNPNANCEDNSCEYNGVCGGLFIDSGGPNGVYGTNQQDTTVICPDTEGTLVSVTFTEFAVEGYSSCSDELQIWEDTNGDQMVSAESDSQFLNGSIGAFCGTLDDLPNEGNFTASTTGNCLMFVFSSNIGTNGSFGGWVANVDCLVPLGCTDVCDTNYDPNAVIDDSTACSGISNCGCTDPNACNYDATLLTDDGSCFYDCNAPTVNAQIVYNQDSCDSDFYCVDIQIQGINGAEYLGSSSIRISYNSNAIAFNGTGEGGTPIGNYTSINFDDDQNSLHPDCESANGGLGLTTYSSPSFDGLVPGTILISFVLLNPTIGTFVSACPNISNEWTDVSTICFEVLDPDANPQIAFVGTENGPIIDDSGTNFNSDTDNPNDKYHNGTLTGLETPTSELPPCTSGCTDPNACNYDATALIDDGSCDLPLIDCALAGFDDQNITNHVVFFNFDGSADLYPQTVVDSSIPLDAGDYLVLLYEDSNNPGNYLPGGVSAPWDGSSSTTVFAYFNEADDAFPYGFEPGFEMIVGIYDNQSAQLIITDATYAVPTGLVTDPVDNQEIWEANGFSIISAISSNILPIPGCTDATACNFDAAANEDDGSCDYSCLTCNICPSGVSLQFVPNQDSCYSNYYCVDIQIQGVDAEYIGNSSIRFSYDPNVLLFDGSSASGMTTGTYTSINFDDDQDSLSPDCETANGGPGFTGYSPHSFDGLITGDILITMVLQAPTIGTFVSACPSIEDEWTDVATICFEVLDPDSSPALSFTGTENGPPDSNTSDTNFNPDTNNPDDKYDNGSFFDLNTPQNEIPGCTLFSCGDLFIDSGGPNGEYSANEQDTTIICPDVEGTILSINFIAFELEENTNTNACWDSLQIWEDLDGDQIVTSADNQFTGGLNTTGGFCGTLDDLPNGGTFTASTPDNCLMFVFSSDSFNTQDGWIAEVTCSPGIQLALRAFLEGPYEPETNTMTTNLYEQGLLPLAQPYNQHPWDFQEESFVKSYDLFPENTVDWVLVELRTGDPNDGGLTAGTVLTHTKAALLLSDGTIVEADGSPLSFSDLVEEKYHVVIRHRNHLDVISSTAVTVSDEMKYDFTDGVQQALAIEQLKDINGKSVLISGDLFGEGVIQITDYDCWAMEPAAVQVYNPNDANLDGVVQVSDFEHWFVNRSKIGCVEICY